LILEKSLLKLAIEVLDMSEDRSNSPKLTDDKVSGQVIVSKIVSSRTVTISGILNSSVLASGSLLSSVTVSVALTLSSSSVSLFTLLSSVTISVAYLLLQ
jgi:hypothetical protein